ncbi:TRAFAC clade GTPase domain-containing protein [Actinomadura chibensis]|uniref:Double-GTPase 2 domain-containing protein n=1 Tax=Actinomadura chibensis TaxID=392828 RepID=A0A5D0NNJ4_9ACTN|nr:hypothetical protein [Actinomadura chibensis]TYB45704.1 hypothetical protein FXF69_20040 [Actinomadura chibensis]
MKIPEIKLTMLGATGSGKTTLMHGMYAMLASGVHGYHLFTQDPDDHLDLMEAWGTLLQHGELPPPTPEKPTSYEMVFNYGLEALLHLDFVDFRGGAGTESGRKAGAHEDIGMLRARLAESNSIYLVLDGRHVGDWVKNGCPPMQAVGPMSIAVIGRAILDLFQRSRDEGRPRPSLVVIITKSDVLAETSGLSRQDAMRMMIKNMRDLVPFAYYDGVTAMICPVQLGEFGLDAGTAVDRSKVKPIFVHKPLIFSLMHYLTEQIAFDQQNLEGLRAGQAQARKELEELNTGFRRHFRGDRIRRKSGEIDFADDEISGLRKDLGTAQQRAAQLMGELDRLPIIRDGEEVK